MPANTNTAELAQRIAELPETDIYVFTDQFGKPKIPVFTAEQIIAAQDKHAAPLIERIKELEYYVQLYKIGCERAEAAATEAIMEAAELKDQCTRLMEQLRHADKVAGAKMEELERQNAELRNQYQDLLGVAQSLRTTLAQSNGQSSQQPTGGV